MKHVILGIVCCSILSASAETRLIRVDGAPFPMPAIPVAVFPARDFPITDYGAKPDGSSCTEAFRRAMAACAAAGGGRVVVPKGTWLSGAIHFKSNCELHFEDGAVLEFTDDPADYPRVHTTWEGVECLSHSPLLFAYEVENVAITGKGLLRPRMALWRDWYARPPAHMKATELLYHWCSTNAPMAVRDVTAIAGANVRPHLIQFNRAKNVLLDGFRIYESPFWMIHLYHSENCVVRNLETWAHGHNNDGLDIDMTRNVLVENCAFDQGDDGICLKAGRNQDAWRLARPTENVVVRNCRIKSAHTLLGIGSELSGGIRNIWMTDCTAGSVGVALRIKTNWRRGGFVRDVFVDNCRVTEAERAFMLDMDVVYQWARFPDYETRLTEIDGIHLRDFVCGYAETGIEANGDKRLEPKNLEFRNVRIGSVRNAFRKVVNCTGVTMENVVLGCEKPNLRHAFCAERPVGPDIAGLSPAHAKAAAFLNRKDVAELKDGVYELGEGAVARIGVCDLRACAADITFETDTDHDTLVTLMAGETGPFMTRAASNERIWAGPNNFELSFGVAAFGFVPAGVAYADRIVYGNPQPSRRIVVKIPKP